MTGLYIVDGLFLVGLVTLIVLKIKWSRAAARKWTSAGADDNAPKE